MKKIVFINSFNYGSTGNMCTSIMSEAIEKGYQAKLFVPNRRANKKHIAKNQELFGNWLLLSMNRKIEQLLGLNDCLNLLSTISLIRKIKRANPDIIHLHNIHSSYINIKILFRFLNKCKKNIVWTLHDCWSFTGRCPHFTLIGCKQWINGCNNCTYSKDDYPKQNINRSSHLWKTKKKYFTLNKSIKLVTPSFWLENLVKESYFSKNQVITIHNGIDLNNFNFIDSNIKEKFDLTNKKILLAVSNPWYEKKGYNDLIELSYLLSKKYKLVLIGSVPSNLQRSTEVLYIPEIDSQIELAEWYSAADLFINPTKEEVLGNVNIESLACGTPVIVYNTGGCPEIVNHDVGCVVNNITELLDAINIYADKKAELHNKCLERAKLFSKDKMTSKYISLYDGLYEQ